MVRRKTAATAAADSSPQMQDAQSPVSKRGRALVFISHDSRDADLAEAFANLLSDVSGGTLKSFRSSDKKGSSGIEFGTEWYKAIMSQLGDATDVVALLTHHSTDRPWILYEAGVAKGKLDTNVLGVALGVPLEKVSTGPFGQFQNCGDDEDSLTKLVIQLLQRNPDASPREEAVRVQVRVFLEGAKKLIPTKGKPAAGASDESNVAKLFEEVKVMVRELPERVDDRVRSVGKRGAMKRMHRFHPMMFEELLFHPALRKTPNGPAAAWLLFLSVFREDVPWLYDMGLDLYQALRSGDQKAISSARADLLAILEATTRGPFFHEMLRAEDEEIFFLVREIPEMVDRFLSPLLESAMRRIRKTPIVSRRSNNPTALKDN
ncbi:MAG: toll/interleukin-1 receptor domain-containing protein [Sterolibacteriaceae bacterium]|nr:toll/interleukin-1 receptor domain-containing protein [Candidatus Methylophosphatis haderslevensis]